MKTAELTIEDRIDLVKKWILDSGIQSETGGVYAWYDIENRSYSYLYSEITGYAITLMSFLYRITKDAAFLGHAERAAQWIIQDASDPSGGVLTREYVKNSIEHYSFERGNIYSFDCAMVAFGMLKLYRITADKTYLDCAEKIISLLNKKMLKADGLYYPIFDTRNNKAQEKTDKWSTQSGSFHCKLALCLCELADIKKDASYSAQAKRLIDVSIQNFYRDERFITNTADNTSHMHPHSYTLEGMLYYSFKMNDASYRSVIEKAFKWAGTLQAADGGFPTQVFGAGRRDISHQRSDIQAQMLRLAYFIKPNFDREKLLERLLVFQNVQASENNGFLFGTKENGVFQKHVNSWCSMFALQALYLASGKADKNILLDHLV